MDAPKPCECSALAHFQPVLGERWHDYRAVPATRQSRTFDGIRNVCEDCREHLKGVYRD